MSVQSVSILLVIVQYLRTLASELSNQINITNTTTLQPISVDKAFSLVNQSIPCTSTTASAQINVDAKTQAQVSFGVVVNGTLAPPQLNQFSIDVSLTADLTGNVDLVANASVSFFREC